MERPAFGGGRRLTIPGGWQHDTLTEDTDLSYRAQMKGWEFVYLMDVVCPAELPVEMTAFKNQQFRWAKGLVQTGIKLLPQILRSRPPLEDQERSDFSPYGKLFLSPDGAVLLYLSACHDCAFLSGLVPDAAHRFASVHGSHDVRLVVLYDFPAGNLSRGLEAAV